ncbi:glycosyltransferase 87 family protein [Austwickia chelonae]|nr:glycosyltransferase 87 family protein [Austwickia chelonae]
MAITHALIAAVWDVYPPDLEVYVRGGRTLLEEGDIYLSPNDVLPFTYPPFAAFLFQGFALAPSMAPPLLTFLSGLALARVVILTFCHVDIDVHLDIRHLFLIFIGSLLLEPITMTFTLGQVNLILLWMIFECAIGDRRWRYIGIGIAGGIKLTPLIFLLPLMKPSRWREMAGNLLALSTTVMIGWLVCPDGTVDFFIDKMRDPKRVGGVEYISNQSLNGMIWRSFGPGGDVRAWLISTLAVIALAAVLTWTSTSRLVQFLICAATGVLVSPISWIHHWVWTLPLIIFLLRGRTVTTGRFRRCLAGLVIFVELSRITWLTPHEKNAEFEAAIPLLLSGQLYIIGALCMLFIFFYEKQMQGPPSAPPISAVQCPDITQLSPDGEPSEITR